MCLHRTESLKDLNSDSNYLDMHSAESKEYLKSGHYLDMHSAESKEYLKSGHWQNNLYDSMDQRRPFHYGVKV